MLVLGGGTCHQGWCEGKRQLCLDFARARSSASRKPSVWRLRATAARYDLPPNSIDARICTYECTFCADCVERLSNVCANCGGGFAPRPIRPAAEWRAGLWVSKRPPSKERVHMSYSWEEVAAHLQRIKDIAPEDR